MSSNSSLKNRVSDYIHKYELLNPGDTVIVGVSGGADSLCLLFLLQDLGGLNLRVLHIHHGIRGESADTDAVFVENLCEKLRVPCKILKYNLPEIVIKTHESLEEAGRRVRYESFLKEAEKITDEGVAAEKIKIAVAHHMDDQAETVLHNIFRGSDLHGLSGMKPKTGLRDSKYGLVRPLLGISRKDIEAYLANRHIDYVTDETNNETDYTRNKIRHIILEEAKEINSNANQHVAQIAEGLMLAQDYLLQVIATEFEACTYFSEETLKLNIGVWEMRHEYIRKEIIRKCIEVTTKRLKDITRKHVDLVCDLGLMGHSGRLLELPYGLIVEKNYDRLLFYIQKTSAVTGVSGAKADYCECKIEILEGITDITYPKENCTKWFDCDKINGTVHWREKRAGDYIVTNAGTQKIQDFLKKQKVPASERQRVRVLAIEETGEILWVYGESISRINEKYKVKDDTQTILQARI